ncbi:MAG: hypothetical protein U9Q70_02125 [Chloroflexota bacterium]|nr:hypothetical protein [Chloroflexota bacterium]
MKLKQMLILSTISVATIIMAGCSGPLPETSIVPLASTVQKVPPGLIAFIGADKQVWLMDPDGHNQQRLTTGGIARSPAWSPNGQLLAYIYQEEGSEIRKAHLYNPLNKTDRLIEADGDPRLALVNWSPHNRYLVLDVGCCSGRSLSIVKVSDGQIVDELGAFGYAWSPNGDRLVFGIRAPLEVPIPVEPGDSISLAMIQVGAGQQPQVIFTGTNQARYFPFAWLPDGRILYNRLDWDESTQTGDQTWWTVTFTGDGEKNEPQPAENIPPAYNRDTVLARLPAEMQNPGTGSFSWSSDGKWIVFYAGEGADNSIYLFNWAEGGQPNRLAAGIYPSWQPASVE